MPWTCPAVACWRYAARADQGDTRPFTRLWGSGEAVVSEWSTKPIRLQRRAEGPLGGIEEAVADKVTTAERAAGLHEIGCRSYIPSRREVRGSGQGIAAEQQQVYANGGGFGGRASKRLQRKRSELTNEVWLTVRKPGA